MIIISIEIDTNSEAFEAEPRQAFLEVMDQVLLFMKEHEVCEKAFYDSARRFYDTKNEKCATLKIEKTDENWRF